MATENRGKDTRKEFPGTCVRADGRYFRAFRWKRSRMCPTEFSINSRGFVMTETEIIAVCAAAFDLGGVRDWTRHGGTAARNWRVLTDRGQWLIRLRGVRTSSDRSIAFDHALRRHLLDHGVPTAAAVIGSDGRSFVRIHGGAYEVYPFIHGVSLDEANPTVIATAARALARFHAACRTFRAAEDLPPIAQYSTLGVTETSHRLEDPKLLTRVYDALSHCPGADRYRPAIDAANDWLGRLRDDFGDAAYEALPHTVMHGDYTLANLLFDGEGEQVRGIFDLDWARWGPRVRDVADGLFFVAGRRRTPLHPGDIWSLTEPVMLDSDRCALWLDSYMTISPLTVSERRCIPLALAARWLSVRAEGTAKVPTARRLEFCFGPLEAPLSDIAYLAEIVD